MSELKEKQTVLAVAAATTVALTCMLGVFSQRTKIKSGINVVRKFELEEGNPWLDQGCYDVITAICDAFMPSIKPSELTVDKVNAAADAIHPDLRHFCVRVDQTLIEQHRAYLCRGAIDLNLHSVIAEVLEKLITKEERLQVWLMLKVLSNSAGCFMVTGNPAPFQDLPLQLRVQALATLRDSPVTQLRMFYQTFKRVTGNLFFSYVAEHGIANPGWKSVNYKPDETVGKGRAAVSEEEKGEEKERDRLLREKVNYPSAYNNLTAGKFVAVPTSADADATDVLECDVVVVGSGSGGGMMAAELAKAGLNVVVLEKGGFYRAEEFKTWRESEAFLHTFEKGGLCSTVDGNVLVLAGSCVGGGSTINWSASFRTPEVVTQDWAAQGMPQFRKGGEFDASLDAVHGLLNVNTDQSFRTPSEDREMQRARASGGKCGSSGGGGGSGGGKGECGSGGSGSNKSDGGCGGGKCGTGVAAPFAINGNNTALWEGAEKLGFRPEKIPRNVQGCVDCGHCCHGCPYSAKQSTQTALFEPLLLDERYRLEVIPHCTVKRVLYEDHEGSVAGADGTRHASHKRAVGVEAEVQIYPANLSDMTVAERLKCIEKFKGRVRKVLVKAKVVVAAAGSIHTPALLLRSGITHRGMVGQHLALHPVLGCGGMFPGVETGLASGVSMGVVVRQPRVTATHDFSKHASMHTSSAEPIGNERFAAAMQTPPGHIGLMGLLFPWAGPGNGGVSGGSSGGGSGGSSKSVKNGAFSGYGGGLSTKLGLLNWRHSCVFIALPRDQSQACNRVSIDSAGNPVLHYTVTAQDTALMMAGLEANLRFMRSAGAKFLYLAHENFPWFHCGTNTSSASSRSVSSSVSPRSSAKTANTNTTINTTNTNTSSTTSTSTRTCTSPTNMNHTPFSADPEFESYIQQIRDHGLHTAKMQIFSAHQMSSCRMAPSPLTGPTSASGELYECMNLFVADGSVLPTSLGINPMVTIESFAHMISKNVIKRACEDVEVRGRVGKFAESGKW